MSKKCLTCDLELSEKARKPHCKKCRHKLASINWIKRNKLNFDKYQERYRNENREICNLRSHKSYLKKSREYNDKNRKYYREVNGISLDDPFRKRKDGDGNYNQGYKTITSPNPGHPNNCSRGRIREHVWIMSQIIGRPLRRGEIVHHKNGIRDDNRPDNLELCHYGQPPGQRGEDKIKYYIEFLNAYGYKVVKE